MLETRGIEMGLYRFARVELGKRPPHLLAAPRGICKRYRAIAYGRRNRWLNAPLRRAVDYEMDQHVRDFARITRVLRDLSWSRPAFQFANDSMRRPECKRYRCFLPEFDAASIA
ncbi:hypothetical protein, partial [Bradyrhizobium guangdongense]|uniref:hypothetical protein n=1 Tax=Bradyrhizobium guangdongense TaxID=1325090 RepID=UPI00131A0FA7